MAHATTKRLRKRISHAPAGDAQPQPEAYVFPSDLGWMSIRWTRQTLQGFAIGAPSASAAEASLAGDCRLSASPPAFVQRLAERLQSYAAGADEDFADVPLDLTHLTDFQRRVVKECRRIGAGRTLTYAQLAEKAGHPGAARAVGSTMARNRFPIVVPCHRVVGSAGSLGGFSAPRGVSLKRQMLDLEKAAAHRRPRPR